MAITGVGNSPEVEEIQQPEEPAKPQETPKPETPATPQTATPASPEKPNDAVAEKFGIDSSRLRAFDIQDAFSNGGLRGSLGDAVNQFTKDGKVSPGTIDKVAEQMSRRQFPLVVDLKDSKLATPEFKPLDAAKDGLKARVLSPLDDQNLDLGLPKNGKPVVTLKDKPTIFETDDKKEGGDFTKRFGSNPLTRDFDRLLNPRGFDRGNDLRNPFGSNKDEKELQNNLNKTPEFRRLSHDQQREFYKQLQDQLPGKLREQADNERVQYDQKFRATEDGGRALARLKPEELEGTLKNLNATQLDDALKAANNADFRTLGKVLSNASKMGDASLKAKMFKFGADELKKLEDSRVFALGMKVDDGNAYWHIRKGLTQMLKDDPNRVMHELTFQSDVSGSGMSSFIKAKLVTGEDKDLGEILGKLRFSNNGNESDFDRFTKKDETSQGEGYKNARVLGRYVGAVNTAVKQIKSDDEKRAETIKNIAGGVLGVAGAFSKPISQVVGKQIGAAVSSQSPEIGVKVGLELLKGLNSQETKSIVAGFKQGKGIDTIFYELGIPFDPATKKRTENTGALSAYDSGFTAVPTLNVK